MLADLLLKSRLACFLYFLVCFTYLEKVNHHAGFFSNNRIKNVRHFLVLAHAQTFLSGVTRSYFQVN